eukprot:TRINITY_DN3469_c0_g1_i1.p2 TRINITY_DN3469_c0_g1~~TRINITY_DN3469_c0_g1_i1.p2  ORF type:complete len:113 (-),score=33.51 TRINITY_DN3469_c0_g1_i1:250-567(-)
MDESSIHGGVQLFREIDQGITDSDVIISCVSDQYGASKNCCREVLLSSEREKIILPVRIGACNPYPPRGDMGPILAGKLYVDLSNDSLFEANFSRLVSALNQSLL